MQPRPIIALNVMPESASVGPFAASNHLPPPKDIVDEDYRRPNEDRDLNDWI